MVLMFFGAVARASSPDAGRAAKVDLDLRPPPLASASPRPSHGASLEPPRGMSSL
jgi:hypothetical protein